MIARMPLCMYCKRLEDDNSCAAFPHGIPEVIWMKAYDHRKPIEGDNGIQFLAKSKETEKEAEEWANR